MSPRCQKRWFLHPSWHMIQEAPLCLRLRPSKIETFYNNLSHYRKMQDYSYIYVSGMVLSNPGITPSSHNLKQLKQCLRVVFMGIVYLLKEECNTYFSHPVFLFCFCKICINNTFRNIAGILLAGYLTVKNQWGLLTGDEGIGNAFPTVLPNADYSYYTLKTSGFKTF